MIQSLLIGHPSSEGLGFGESADARNRFNGFTVSLDVVKLLKQFGDHRSSKHTPLKRGVNKKTLNHRSTRN